MNENERFIYTHFPVEFLERRGVEIINWNGEVLTDFKPFCNDIYGELLTESLRNEEDFSTVLRKMIGLSVQKSWGFEPYLSLYLP